MYPHARGLCAAITLLVWSLLVCSIASGQNARLPARMPDVLPSAIPPLALASCNDDLFPAPISHAVANSAEYLRSNCDMPSTPAVIDPCVPDGFQPRGCKTQSDPVPLALEGLGKQGRKISRARVRVLEILQGDNACSAWFQQSMPSPADAFRMISFELDRKGEGSVLESRDPGYLVVFRSPYVARVIQGEGVNATITINEKGAFFSMSARVMGVRKEGGPLDFRGQRSLRAGPYGGGTLQAQVVTLLHEFGHALDLLPVDENDVDGKSSQNTEEVLRYCRAEVEGKANPPLLRAAK